jgi:4-amino-4-deoxy-L-arabinose transferase-like glycosyltransferase
VVVFRAAGILVFVLVGIAYLFGLGGAPVYLGGDEAHFAVGGYAIATTGRNLNGDFLPLFFNLTDPQGDPQAMPWGNTWYHPVMFYLVALALKVLPLSVAAVRVPAALLGGVVIPLLTYAVARRMRLDRLAAAVAALVIALAPASVILSRQALDYICPLPFVLAWLWCLLDYLDTGARRSAALIGLLLGLGCYSYIAAWALMPALLVVSWAAFWRQGSGWRPVLSSAAGFAAAMLLIVPWLWTHPQMIQETVVRYQVLDAQGSRASDGAPRLGRLQSALPAYATYFDPVFLFRRGGLSMTSSSGRMGVFLIPVAVFFPLGLVSLWRRGRQDLVLWILLAGLLLAPIPAAMSGQPRMIQRALLMLPFVALLSGAGFAELWATRHRAWRYVTIALLVIAPLQFAVFYWDYFNHYKLRSAFYYDSVAFTSVADRLTADPAVPAIYLRRDLDAIWAKWRFYATAAGQVGLLARTTYFSDRADVAAAPPGSLLVMYVENDEMAALQQSGQWALAEIINDVDQRPAAAILRRVGP